MGDPWDSEGLPALLAGRYRTGAELGRGGMAVVHRAWDQRLGRDVAIKVLRTSLTDEATRIRFELEGRLLAGLDHPGLVGVFDAGLAGDRPYLVLELVDGVPLHDHVRRWHPSAAEVARMGADLADVLAHVHARGITHRDVKPGNVLVGPDRTVRLTDFGIARLMGDTSRLTSTGMIMGTAAYLAPEQVRGEPATGAADIYALGLVLIEACTGRPVYQGAPDVAALARLVNEPEIDEALVPPGLAAVLRAMTHTDPVRRPSAADAAAALLPQSVVETEHEPTLALETGRPQRAAVLALAGGVLLAVALTPVLMNARSGPSTAEVPPAASSPTPSTSTTLSPTATHGPGAGSRTAAPSSTALTVDVDHKVTPTHASSPTPTSHGKKKDKGKDKGNGNGDGNGNGNGDGNGNGQGNGNGAG